MYNATCKLLHQIYWKLGNYEDRCLLTRMSELTTKYPACTGHNTYLSVTSNANYRLWEGELECYWEAWWRGLCNTMLLTSLFSRLFFETKKPLEVQRHLGQTRTQTRSSKKNDDTAKGCMSRNHWLKELFSPKHKKRHYGISLFELMLKTINFFVIRYVLCSRGNQCYTAKNNSLSAYLALQFCSRISYWKGPWKQRGNGMRYIRSCSMRMPVYWART
jgi:hypothetical protein